MQYIYILWHLEVLMTHFLSSHKLKSSRGASSSTTKSSSRYYYITYHHMPPIRSTSIMLYKRLSAFFTICLARNFTASAVPSAQMSLHSKWNQVSGNEWQDEQKQNKLFYLPQTLCLNSNSTRPLSLLSVYLKKKRKRDM